MEEKEFKEESKRVIGFEVTTGPNAARTAISIRNINIIVDANRCYEATYYGAVTSWHTMGMHVAINNSRTWKKEFRFGVDL